MKAEQDQDTLAVRGDCVLALKGDPGLFVVCRLYVGRSPQMRNEDMRSHKRSYSHYLCMDSRSV